MKTVFASMERWFRRHSIRNLMTYVVGGMLVVFLMDFLLPSLRVESWLHLNWHLVMRGQVWRLLTFVLLPPSSSLVWILFSLYFYWLIGNALENHWGTARFNMFYSNKSGAAMKNFSAEIESPFCCLMALMPSAAIKLF